MPSQEFLVDKSQASDRGLKTKFKMEGLRNVKEWVLLLGAVGFIGLVFWSGLNVLTLKTILLWILISFGFLTLIFHAFGSSLLGLVQKAFGAESEDKTKKEFSKEEIRRRKERSRMKKQATFNDKNEQYRENVMLPKQEAELIKRKKEAQKFHPHWKGEGHRLGSTPGPNICSCGQAHDDVDTDEMDPDCLLDYVEDTQSSSDEQGDIDINMTQESLKSNEQHKNINTVRQRKKDKSSEQQTANNIGNKEQTFNLLYEEPALGAPGTVTVAFRCPNGETKKRRFNIESHIQCLVDFAESLGYSPTNYCIMTTYPRKPLSDTTKTLTDVGLTHDVVLVIDDLDE